ncbi:MAG: UDP-glucose--hexose-1-phosphate uridylyltransferase [Sarcina sp.]
MVNINLEINKLINYALDKNLIENEDIVFATNRILNILKLDSYTEGKNDLKYGTIEDILNNILNWACDNGIIENSVTERELLDSNLMGSFIKRPSEVIKEFYDLYEKDPIKATDNYYEFSGNTNYIRRERVKKDLKWITNTKFGELDITINMSKPEKDPVEIEKALKIPQGDYPKCLLCKECEGYSGRLNYPSRSNHRIIPMELNGAKWFMQYSPYVYFNEHSIILKGEHTPMSINKDSFIELLEFVDKFKHYFIGSNADLPIVGGSILTHDHYQSGRYVFTLEKAKNIQEYKISGFENIEVARVNWPMTVIRARSNNKEELVEFADMVLNVWREYTDETVEVLHKTEEMHNTITPICRYKDNKFEIDLVLRNNRRTKEHPFGMFHPHIELHHIKKENIGLIEVMGLAVLPPRLNKEIPIMKEYLLTNKQECLESIKSHEEWLLDIKERVVITEENIDDVIKDEIGNVFLTVLEHCGVFKLDEKGKNGFNRFVDYINQLN